MTQLMLTLFSKRKTGGLLILCLLNNLHGDFLWAQSHENLENSKFIASKFEDFNLDQLAYSKYLECYFLTASDSLKIEFAKKAYSISLKNERIQEALKILDILSNDFPQKGDSLNLFFGYNLAKSNYFQRADLFLQKSSNADKVSNEYLLLRGFVKLMLNQPDQCISLLSKTYFINETNLINDINLVINKLNEKKFTKKRFIVSVPLSLAIPGLGQLYSGFYYDALKNLVFNGITFISAYSSWRYEFSKPINERNYFFPVCTGIVFGLFYITNIYNVLNLTQKANLFHQNKFYKEIGESLKVIIDKRYTQIGINIKI